MKESDWKIFKQLKEKAIEVFCRRALDEFEGVIKNEKENVYNRYLLLYKLVRNRDKQMGFIFDEHSRSKAALQLLAMRGEGLADEQLLAKLSEEFRNATDPQKFNR